MGGGGGGGGGVMSPFLPVWKPECILDGGSNWTGLIWAAGPWVVLDRDRD